MIQRVARLGVDDIVELLSVGAARPLRARTSVSQLDHALQTAALLEQWSPDDPELAAAGLVHDIGHLMPGVGDEAHPAAAAEAVHAALGERVAGLVALHVEAKRYLVAIEPGYDAALASDSTSSLEVQGGPLSPEQVAAFGTRPLAAAATVLRRADDRAKVEGLVVRDLGSWEPLLRKLSGEGARRQS